MLRKDLVLRKLARAKTGKVNQTEQSESFDIRNARISLELQHGDQIASEISVAGTSGQSGKNKLCKITEINSPVFVGT